MSGHHIHAMAGEPAYCCRCGRAAWSGAPESVALAAACPDASVRLFDVCPDRQVPMVVLWWRVAGWRGAGVVAASATVPFVVGRPVLVAWSAVVLVPGLLWAARVRPEEMGGVA
jgi:hypothetical protein